MPSRMKNGKWRAEKKINYVRKTKVFLTKKEAVAWEAAQTAELWVQQAAPIHTVSCYEWGTQYLDMCRERFVYKTYQEKLLAVKLLIKSVGADFPAEDLTPVITSRHLRVQNRERSGYAANKDRKNLRAAWEWGVKYLGLPKDNPFSIEKFAEKRSPRYIPTIGDMEMVLQSVSGAEYALLLTMLHTAGRKTEVLDLRWSDIDFQESSIALKTRKRKDGTQEIDRVPMTATLKQVLLEHRRSTDSICYVFSVPCARKFMARACKKAGVKPFGFHSIRHLSACMMDKAGVPLGTIQAVLRHKSAATTSRYLHSLRGVQANLDDVFNCKVLELRSQVS